MRKKLIDCRKCRPFVEQLEPRLLLDGGGIFHPMIVAGDPAGSPADSPADRVTTGYEAVGSVFVGKVRGFVCTGTVISTKDANGDQTTSQKYVLTAGHCVDKDDNGSVDYDPKNITFYPDGDTSTGIKAVELFKQPDFGGFNNPEGIVNDDLFIFKLAAPAGVTPIPIHAGSVSADDVLTLVGFGRSGDGINGYTVDASLSVKREGKNVIDSLGSDDEGSGTHEIYLADFDAPTTAGSLGNDVETTVGGGDSGGPGLVNCDTTGCELAAVNTFTEGSNAPLFGSGLGGILVDAYSDWIDDVLLGGISGNTGGKGGGGGGGGGRPGGGGPGGRPNSSAVVAANQRLVADETGLNSFRNDIFGRSAFSDHGSGSKTTDNDLVRDESPQLVVLRPRSANIYAISANHKAEENGDKRSIEDVDLVFTEFGELDSLTLVQGFVWMRS